MNSILFSMLISLLLTLAVELIAAVIAGVRGSDLLIIGLINCLTNPVVNFLYDWVWLSQNGQGALPFVCLALLEIAVLFCEAYLFKKLLRFNKIKPLLLSLLLNGASFLTGELISLVIIMIK